MRGGGYGKRLIRSETKILFLLSTLTPLPLTSEYIIKSIKLYTTNPIIIIGEQMPGDEGLEIYPVCVGKTDPKVFHVEDIEIHGAECINCKKTYLNADDVLRYAEFKQGSTAADRVIC
jgi:hypothetical protein